MPPNHALLEAAWTYTQDEYQHITLGLIPEQMEDKWFIYHQDDWLHCHRSWTGVCIFQAHFKGTSSGWTVSQVRVNRDPEQYQGPSDAYDLQLLRFLIEALLLGKPTDFPRLDQQNTVEGALQRWHLVGREKPQHP